VLTIHHLLLPGFLAFTLTVAGFAQAPGSTVRDKDMSRQWIERSNRNAQLLLDVVTQFSPEHASFLGITSGDARVSDLNPGYRERQRRATRAALAQLQERLQSEKDTAVRQDLEIMIQAGEERLRESELEEQHLLPFIDVAQLVFQGCRSLLDDQLPPQRREMAVRRLRRYAGMEPGTLPMAQLAEQRTRELFARSGLQGPFQGEVEKALANDPTYIAGVEQLFQKYSLSGYQEAYAKLKEQLAAYDAFLRKEMLPRARTDFRLPPELYAQRLKLNGIPVAPEALAAAAHAAFDEIQGEMMALAPQVAKQKGFKVTDYRDIIRELKKEQWTGQEILPNYERRIGEIEEIIRRERLVELPERPLRIRLASEAESAAVPAPYMQPPPMIGNTGQTGIFVLPLRIPAPAGSKPGETMAFDDFTFAAASWTLTAHEGRPGHELQFDSMVEQGISLARAIFSFNSTNVEGWGLYSEAILKPFMPPDGQLISLQQRLMRAARAFLDPELQAGRITPEQARRVLTDDVGLSPAMANSEVERYTFWSPGQAPTYFYGFTQLMRLRSDTERAMGPRFDQLTFHRFVLDQGILPPPLMREAVMERYVGAARTGLEKNFAE
jgi:hypothetical protein